MAVTKMGPGKGENNAATVFFAALVAGLLVGTTDAQCRPGTAP
eukprot:SAG22_NODE_3344_length_1767_cov_1.121703_1_plen_42_part_10